MPPVPSRPPRAARLSVEDWVDAAETAFIEGGLDAVAVEPVARRLGATKGSFYWHFTNRAALVEATLARWLARTDAIIEALAEVEDPAVRLETLFGVVYEDAGWVWIETDLLSKVADPAVGAAVEEATRRRLGFMAGCLRELGAPEDAASDSALQAYALWIGLLQLTRAAPGVVPAGENGPRFQEATLRHLRHLMPSDGEGEPGSRGTPSGREVPL